MPSLCRADPSAVPAAGDCPIRTSPSGAHRSVQLLPGAHQRSAHRAVREPHAIRDGQVGEAVDLPQRPDPRLRLGQERQRGSEVVPQLEHAWSSVLAGTSSSSGTSGGRARRTAHACLAAIRRSQARAAAGCSSRAIEFQAARATSCSTSSTSDGRRMIRLTTARSSGWCRRRTAEKARSSPAIARSTSSASSARNSALFCTCWTTRRSIHADASATLGVRCVNAVQGLPPGGPRRLIVA